MKNQLVSISIYIKNHLKKPCPVKTFINERIFKKTSFYLGRWKIDYCDDKIKQKVDWANIDHCGTCSKNNEVEKYTKKKELEKK
jgi:hypothetical protein